MHYQLIHIGRIVAGIIGRSEIMPGKCFSPRPTVVFDLSLEARC